jgi:hypothetical protein
MTTITGTMLGKSGILLEKEMEKIFRENGLKSWASFERKRGRVELTVEVDEIDKATALFLARHPDFQFSYRQPSEVGTTRFLVFKQLWQ